jgi:hypothetical protein
MITLVVIFVPEITHAAKLYEVLQGNDTAATTIEDTWNGIISMMNYAAIGVLIFIAFANILRININTYGIKKFLPTLVLALILANFSYFICRFFIDIANIIMDALINSPNGAGVGIGTKEFGIAKSFYFDASSYGEGTLTTLELLRFLLLTLGQYVGAIIVLILALLFFIRNYIIYFLVALSPIAFLATVLPQTKGVFNTWWSNFLKWVFMPIAALFWLWVGGKFIQSFSDSWTFLGFVFAIACYYLAITTPFKMGGGIMNAWKGWSEKVGKKAWGATGAQAVKGGKWMVGGGAASYAQFRYQAKAKQAKQLGREADIKKYEARANAAALLNPQTYKRAIKERMAFSGAQSEKAVAKSGLYNKIVGGAKQIDVMKEVTAGDWKDASAFEAGEAAGQLMKKLQASTKQNVVDFMSRRRKEVEDLDEARVRAGMAAFTPEEERTALADRTMRWFRTTGSQDVEDTLGVAGDPKLDRTTLAEATNIAGAWGRKSGRQFSRDREHGLASGMASSMVGERIDRRYNNEQTVVLERAALAGEENIEEIAKRVGVDATDPAKLDELREHYKRISDALTGAVEDEIRTIQEEIDQKLVGAKHVYDASLGKMRRPEMVEKEITEGLAKVNAGDVDGAKAVAGRLGMAELGDVNADQLKKHFLDLQEGAGLIRQSATKGISGDWANYERAMRETLLGGESAMREQAKGIVEAKMAFAKSLGGLAAPATTNAVTSLDSHIEALTDAILSNHNELAGAVAELKSAGNTSAIADLHKQIGGSITDNLRSVFPNMMASDRATAAVDQVAFERAMRRVYNDPAAVKGLSRSIAQASTMAMGQVKQKMVVDVKAPPGVTATAKVKTTPKVTK